MLSWIHSILLGFIIQRPTSAMMMLEEHVNMTKTPLQDYKCKPCKEEDQTFKLKEGSVQPSTEKTKKISSSNETSKENISSSSEENKSKKTKSKKLSTST